MASSAAASAAKADPDPITNTGDDTKDPAEAPRGEADAATG